MSLRENRLYQRSFALLTYLTFIRIGIDVSYLSGIYQLDISHNHLHALPAGLQFLTKLKKLNLAHNSLSVLTDEIFTLTSLVELNVAHNKLTTLPYELPKRLPDLTTLRVQHNRLEDLPCDLANISLEAHDNPLHGIPADIRSKKITKVRYFGQLHKFLRDFV